MSRATENIANAPARRTVVVTAASTEDRPLALQRWESDGGALPAWPAHRRGPG